MITLASFGGVPCVRVVAGMPPYRTKKRAFITSRKSDEQLAAEREIQMLTQEQQHAHFTPTNITMPMHLVYAHANTYPMTPNHAPVKKIKIKIKIKTCTS